MCLLYILDIHLDNELSTLHHLKYLEVFSIMQAVRRMKSSPLTAEEIARIQEVTFTLESFGFIYLRICHIMPSCLFHLCDLNHSGAKSL